MRVYVSLDHDNFGASRETGRQTIGIRNDGFSLGVLLISLAALAAFRVAALYFNNTDLFTDEAQYWSWSRDLAFGYYSKPPLIAWMIAAITPLCGDGEFCVRVPSVFMHLATSLVVYSIGVRLVSRDVGFWSALTFATLPGISLSSGIISTDVPLLFAWSVAVLAFVELVRAPSYAMAALLGMALGFGLNAKYAMAYFVPCAAMFLVLAPERRALLKQPHLWIAAAIAGLLITPNLLWNATHGFATFSHTAENANWTLTPFHPGKALEFIGSQFGVFGPILFGALIVILASLVRELKTRPGTSLSIAEKLLLAFSVPIIVAITCQALLSRSLANWAAPAYVTGTLLVVHVLFRDGTRRWLYGALALNSVIAFAIAAATSQAGYFTLPGGSDPFSRTLGNRELAEAIRIELLNRVHDIDRPESLLTDDRDVSAALLYYGRDFNMPLFAWRRETGPRNHFELSRAFNPETPEPILLISHRPDGSGIPRQFGAAQSLGPLEVSAGLHAKRTVYLFQLSGFRGG